MKRRDDRRRILQLRIVPELRKPVDRRAGTKLDQRIEDGSGRHRIPKAPGEAQGILPVAHRAVPALGVALALVEVVDQSVPQGAPAVVADQRPLIGGLL